MLVPSVNIYVLMIIHEMVDCVCLIRHIHNISVMVMEPDHPMDLVVVSPIVHHDLIHLLVLLYV